MCRKPYVFTFCDNETEFNYSYDKAGLLLSVNDTSYKYNRFGELIKQTQNGISQNFSYNSLGNRQTYSLTNGEKAEMYLSYTYDSAGRLSGVSSPLGKQIYTYDKANRLISSNNAVSRIGSVYTYYPSGNIKTLSQTHGLEATDFVSYEYNKNGFRTVENGPDIEKRYVYDSQNRLSQSFDQKRNLLSVYNYDEFGNISKIENFVNGHSNETLYSYDRNNRLVSRNIDGTTTNYTYDRQGNLVYDGTSVYRYNGFNRLVGINSDHSNISYTYDHTGLRTSKTVNGVYTKLINDGQNVVAQYVDGRASYFYRGNSLIGYTNSNNDVNFYQFNAHGDVVSILDCFGNTVRNYEYDAFGKQRVNPKVVINTRRDDNPFRYCGEYFDSETNLIYLRARYYNPNLQRFLSEDPVKDGVNWYVYCGNNPVMFFDPTGRITEKEIELYESGQLSQNIYDILVDLGERWENASTQAGRDEIHGLAERFRNNGYKYSDLTVQANEELENNKLTTLIYSYFVSDSSDLSVLFWYAMAGLDWYDRVDNDGVWDYKKVPASWMPKNADYFVYNGKLISFADFGNINYGYTGTVLGVEPKTLYMAAGYVQTGKLNNIAKQYYGDSEVDYFNVNSGIKLANDEGYKGFLELPLSLIFEVMK